jgi:hypothetical protein
MPTVFYSVWRVAGWEGHSDKLRFREEEIPDEAVIGLEKMLCRLLDFDQ